jgi:hypothetical protein
MIVKGVTCLKCNTFVFSRYRYDFRRCPCKTFAVDGGPQLEHILYPTFDDRKNWMIKEQCEIKATENELIADYQQKRNNFGWLQIIQSRQLTQ